MNMPHDFWDRVAREVAALLVQQQPAQWPPGLRPAETFSADPRWFGSATQTAQSDILSASEAASR